MTVAELIAFLETQPQDLPVAYRIHSEQCLLEAGDIGVEHLQHARPDGWVHHARPDAQSVPYLVFPGN
jgi:hypothetical protein